VGAPPSVIARRCDLHPPAESTRTTPIGSPSSALLIRSDLARAACVELALVRALRGRRLRAASASHAAALSEARDGAERPRRRDLSP
jgi:hypothetical protein